MARRLFSLVGEESRFLEDCTDVLDVAGFLQDNLQDLSLLFLMGVRLIIWDISQHIPTRKVMAYKREELSYTPRAFQELADM